MGEFYRQDLLDRIAGKMEVLRRHLEEIEYNERKL
jgi:hypothetical protein